MFTEPSTRTRVSFELAAKRLGADVVNLEVQLSSRVKGESMLDTIYTLEACHVDVFVIRDAEAGVPGLVASHVQPHVSVLSAGEGTRVASHAGPARRAHHPAGQEEVRRPQGGHRRRRQAFARGALGLACARRRSGSARFASSRRGRSCPRPANSRAANASPRIDAGIAGVDVIMMLRIQKERMATAQIPDADRYFAKYGLSAERLAKAKPDAIVMHPQPMNRGIEIASDVADGPQSVIRDQVRNGVAVRMAVLEAVIEGRGR